MDLTFLALTQRQPDLEWLQASLSGLGQVLHVDNDSLDALLRLVDVTQASLIFVGLDREKLGLQSALIEDCIEAKPMLSMVAMGDGLDNQLVLTAMRAGAKDFIAYGSRSSEVAGLVRRLHKRLPSVAPARVQAEMFSLYCCQADPQASLITSHIALSLTQPDTRVLLLDLGEPAAESLDSLGIQAAFNFEDALRNMRRLDASLIDSAFARHSSGLSILSATLAGQLQKSSATEVYLLLGSLRQHFNKIVVNLAGAADSDALRVFISQSQQLIWLTDQSVPNCRRNLEQLKQWRSGGVHLSNCQLLVDRYLKSVSPDLKALEASYELPLIEHLPFQPELRLNAKNQGRSLFEMAPREALSRRLKALAKHLTSKPEPETASGFRLWGRSR